MPPKLRAKAAYHAGIVSWQEAHEAGMSRSAIRSRVTSHRWQTIYRGVYATFAGALSRDAQLWAAVIHAGDGVLLSHETAAELHKLTDEQDPVIHVTVPHECQVHSTPGLKVHRTRRVTDLRFPLGQLPRTMIEETILDLAAGMDRSDDVCALVTKAFARSLAGEAFLRTALAQRARQRWRAEIEEFISAATGGAHSVLEVRYDRDVEKAHGLPRSRRQVQFKKKDGSTGYRDRVYDDCKVVVELDGRETHEGREWEDKRRDNAAAEDGEQSLRYEWHDVRWDPCGTAVQVANVLRARGWKGTPSPCSPECAVNEADGLTKVRDWTRWKWSWTRR